MNFFKYSTLVLSITSFGLGLLVYLKNRESKISTSWFLMSSTIALWSFGLAMMASAPNAKIAEMWLKVHYFGCILVPPTYLHFIFSFLDLAKRRTATIKICYFFSFVILILFFSGFLVSNPIPKFAFNFYTVPGILYFVYVLDFFIIVLYCVFLLIENIRQTKGLQRRRYIYVLLASTFTTVSGTSVFLPVFNIFHPMMLYANSFAILYPILITYAILRYRLMDIEVIIRETAVFAGMFGFSVGVFAAAMYLAQTYIEPYTGAHKLLFPAIVLFLVTLTVRPIEKFMYNTVGKLLFKKRQKYQKTLRDAAEGMANIRNPEKLLGLITHILSKNLNPINVAVYVFDEPTNTYVLRSARYPSKVNKGIEFSSEEPLIFSLKEDKQPVVFEEIEHWLKEEQTHPHKEILSLDIANIKTKMQSLNASVCLPSFYHENELLAVFVLGDKKSGDLYTQDDLELLRSLADEAAIAIRNSILYRNLQQKADEVSLMYEKEQVMFMHAATAFANAIDARDPYTHGHSERVTNYSLALAEQMEPTRFGSEEKYNYFKKRLKLAGLLHDIGKIATPDRVLKKPGPLNSEEWEEMKKHPVVGAKVLGFVKGLWDIVPAVRHHHERYDGKGYPDALKEENIPFMARVLAAADTFDAMTSDRPYRKALDTEVSKQEINNNSATQFDPYVVGVFMKAYAKGNIAEIMRQNR